MFKFLEYTFGYTEEDIVSRRREKHLSRVRVCGYAILKAGGFSLSHIGEVMGGRTHATVIKSLGRLTADEHREILDMYNSWVRMRKEGNYTVLRLTFPDGTSCIGYTHQLSSREIWRRINNVKDKWNCRTEIIKGNLSLDAAQALEQAEELRRKFTGGRDEKE